MKSKDIDADIFVYSTGEELMDTEKALDILFLDIEMPGMSGLEVKEQFQRIHKNVIIIFVTNYQNYVFDAFGLNVIGFLSKPVDRVRFVKMLEKAIFHIQIHVRIRLEEGKYLYSSNITHFYAKRVYTYACQSAEDKGALIRKSLNEWEKLLGQHGFIRIHRSYLVNMQYIEKVKGYKVFIQGRSFPLSREKKKMVIETYEKFCREMAGYL